MTDMARSRHEKVTFAGLDGVLVGDLYLPAPGQDTGPVRSVVVAGSWTTVKEQMAGRYARGLAERGIAALAFDFTGYGESAGTPRDWERPQRKVADLRDAVAFLRTRPDLAPDRVGALGVCAGAGYTAAAAARDARIRSVGLVAPWLHDATLVQDIYGGREGVAQRVLAGQRAARKFRETGAVDYVPAVSTEDENAAMYGPFSYYLDTARGAIAQWSNRFAVMAWPDWLGFDPISVAPRVAVPVALVHSEDAAIPEGARRFHRALPGEASLTWLSGDQFDFYDQDPIVDSALDLIGKHFTTTL